MRADYAGQVLLYGPPKPKAARKAGAEREPAAALPAPEIQAHREDDGGCVTGGPMPEFLRNRRLPPEPPPPPPPKLTEPPAKPRSATATKVLAMIGNEIVIDQLVIFYSGDSLSPSQVRHARAELIERGEAEYTGGTSRTTSGKPAKEWRRKGGPR